MSSLSIVVPCYNEQETIQPYLNELTSVVESSALSQDAIEVIMVDDGSKDNTLAAMKQAVKQAFPFSVRYVSFSRNFGKEAALYAGVQASRGDYVAVMDVDLQDPPALLPEMISILKSGEYDCVATRRVTRKGEPPIRSFFARTFYKLINSVSDVEIVDGARDYRAMTRQCADAFLSLKEKNRFAKGLFPWVGFNTRWLEYENIQRVAGETKWSFWGLAAYAIEGIVAFTTAPLTIASVVGGVFCLLSLLGAVFVAVRAMLFGDPVAGWPSLMCAMMFLGGVQMLCLGIFGSYLARLYTETKARPIYITKEQGGFE